MEKETMPSKQSKEAEKAENIWQSGFDATAVPTLRPPAILPAAEPAHEQAQEDSDDVPETVVFDIGGLADPQDPTQGDNGKGIKVLIPPDLDGPTALVQVVMTMMRLSESEARILITREKIQWVDYKQEGHGKDRAGNVIHLMRFKPAYAERVAHEPGTLRPTEGDDLLAYKQFKCYLQEHDEDNIRDPYAQYDRMAERQGWFIEKPTLQAGAANIDGPRLDYERQRKTIVEFVIWERLRAKRETLAAGIDDETTGLKTMVEQLADRFPSLVDVGALQYYMPTRYYNAWESLHVKLILAQGELERGNPSTLQGAETGDKLFQLAYWFAEHANERFGTWSASGREYYKFNASDVLGIQKLATAKEFGLDESTQLLHYHYKLTFAIMEVAGRAIAYGTEKTMLQSHEDKGLNLQGRQVENQGKMGTAMLDLLHNHPVTRKVNATFYPEEETKDFRQGGEKNGSDDWSQGIALELMEAMGAEAKGLHGAVHETKAPKPRKDRAAKVGELKERQMTLNDEFNRYWREEGLGRFIPTVMADMNTLGAFGSLIKGISVPNYRRLFKIVGGMMRNGMELSVEGVLLHLGQLGLRVKEILHADRVIIQLAIDDVKRAGMTAEEIAFADAYRMHAEADELTNYELRELYQRGYTVNPETGALVAPTGRIVDFHHEFLPSELRTQSVDFNRQIDFSTDQDLMALVEARKRLRAQVAEMRQNIKERKARGEEIPKAEMEAFNKVASTVGVYSEQIAERSLQKYLEGEGFILIYPEPGAPSSKSGDFDRIYLKEQDGRYCIFECKGGSSKIKDRLCTDVAGVERNAVAEQGTLPYMMQILYEMGKKGTTVDLVEEIGIALHQGKVDYLYFRQGLDVDGNLLNPEIKQFDIREPNKIME